MNPGNNAARAALAKAMQCSIEPVIEADIVRPVRIADCETVPVALIISELAFNAIKHGRPGEPVTLTLFLAVSH